MAQVERLAYVLVHSQTAPAALRLAVTVTSRSPLSQGTNW